MTMRVLYFLVCCLWTISLFGQSGKPLYKPSKSASHVSQLKPITTSLKGIPKAKKHLLNTFKPSTLPTLQRSLKKDLGVKILQTSKDGSPIMIGGTLKTIPQGRDVALQVFDYLEAIKNPLQIKSPKAEFQVMERKTDKLGQQHFKMQQYYKDLKVYGGQVWLHAKEGKVNLFNGRNHATPAIDDLSPSINQAKALSIAEQEIAQHTKIKTLKPSEKKLIGDLKEPELLVYHPIKTKEARLAWHLHLYPNVASQWEYFIDAKTGEVLDAYPILCQLHYNPNKKSGATCNHVHNTVNASKVQPVNSNAQLQSGPATAVATDLNNFNRTINSYDINGDFFLIDASKSMFSATKSQLPNEPVGAIWTINAQNTYPGNDNFDAIHVANRTNTWNDRLSVSAHYNAGVAFDYFRNVHGRNSINGSGGTIISVVNVSDEDGSSLENAFWSGQAMFYGNGGNTFEPLAKSLDVAAHEMSHGVIQNTANLRYQGESGAMNESFADVFGVLVDNDDWQLGEDVVNRNIFRSGALRDVQNPHNGGTRLGDPGWQPAHLSEKYTGSQDNGGVHINSGIVNRAFYLVANSLGLQKTEQIYYRALSNYLVMNSQFQDLRVSLLQAATDIHGANTNEVAAIANAFDQVGILGSNTGGGSNSGGETSVEVEANTGEDFVIYTDNNKANLYIADGSGNIIATPFTTTGIISRPSVTDDGSAIVFVAEDKTIHLITIDWENGGEASEEVIQDQQIWRNVAVSRDGYRIAALQDDLTNTVDVFDFTLEEWKTYELYNPTFTEGISTGEVQYADIIEFDFTGQYVMYDAFNKIAGDFGANDIEYWDIGFLKVYDLATDNFEQNVNNNISKLFSGLAENISIGNPTFSKNSPNVIAFDYIDGFENTYELRGVNISNNAQSTIFENSTLSHPSYGRLDDRIIFNAQTTGGSNVVAVVSLNSDKISVPTNANASILVSQSAGAQLGVWFSDGSRQLTAVNDLEKSITELQISPNPFSDILDVQFTLEKSKDLELHIFNALGQAQISKTFKGNTGFNQLQLEGAGLPAGTYLISIQSEEGIISKKLLKY